MESNWLFASLLLATFIAIFLTKKLFNSKTESSLKLPPSPSKCLPILGHLHLLEPPMYKTLYKLSKQHGPIFSLRLGSRHAVVLSSSDAVEEAFTKNDKNFANRPNLTIHRHQGYNYTALTSTNYSDHWKNLRRLCSIDIFSPGRLNTFLSPREGEVQQLVKNIYNICSSSGFNTVELRSKISELTFNNITNMVAGKKFYGDVDVQDREAGKKFQELIGATFKFSGASNAGDFVPFLRWLDYAGIEKNMSIICKEMDEFLQGLVDELRNGGNGNETMIGHLLELQKAQPDYYTDDIIKGLTLNMLIGGTYTSETTIEWAMSLLINHPQVLMHARDEIDTHVGFDRLIKEKDLSKLKLLNNIISETFRLFPPLPLLVPHESSENCKLGGYDVPGGTIIFANVWVVHRDPRVWDEPDSFNPNRFEGRETEAYNKLLQFGMGRRVCPGLDLGQRVVGLALGSLIQNFEWKAIDGGKVDLTEGTGLTIRKINPLVVMCKPRDEMNEVLKI